MEDEQIALIKQRLKELLGKPFGDKHYRTAIPNELRQLISDSRNLASSEEEMSLIEEGAVASLKNALDYMENETGFTDASIAIAEDNTHHAIGEALEFFDDL